MEQKHSFYPLVTDFLSTRCNAIITVTSQLDGGKKASKEMKDQSLSKARKLKIMYHHIETAEPLISKYIFYSLQYVTDGLDNPTLWIFQCTLVESLQRIPGNNTVSVYYSQKVFFITVTLH